jgi:hypothetical protein
MLQAMMLKMGSGKISYHNSRTKSTHRTILSLDYIENRLLLLRFRYKLYYYYVSSLSNINRDLYAKILQMLDTLLAQLTTEERNLVFAIPPPEEPIPEMFEESGIVFKIVVKRIVGFSHFIITNIKSNYIFETGLVYTFDLSDHTNLNTAFCLSLEQDGVAYDCRYHLTPGQPGANMKVYLSINIPTTRLYVFNRDEPVGSIRYEQWGYSYESIFVNRDKLVYDTMTVSSFRTFDTSYLKFNVFEWYGPKIMLDPYVSSDPSESSNPVYLYKNNYMYKLGIGVHYIYLHNYYSIAFLTKNNTTFGISSQYNRGVKTLDGLFLAGEGLNGDYTFHSGMIRLTILGPFDPVTVYNDKYGYMGGLFMIQYSPTSLVTAAPDEFISTNTGSRYGLDSQTLVNTNPFSFQNIPYASENRFALAKGMYTVYNTTNTPFTLLNTGKTEWITIESLPNQVRNGVAITTAVLGVGPKGEECVFYYGTIILRVYGNFGSCSLYSPRKGRTDGGYSGGHGLLVYDETFSSGPSYTGRGLIPPNLPSTNTTSTLALETFKPSSVIELTLASYTLYLGDVYIGNTKYGNSSTSDMRYVLTPKTYLFVFQGTVTLYGTSVIENTYTLGITSYRVVNNIPTFPIYRHASNQTTAFYVKDTMNQDFCIVHEQGGNKYTFFMTYQTSSFN